MRFPTRFSVATIVVVLMSTTSGCHESPSDVLAAIESAAEAGDAVAFANGFTSESRPFAEALLRIQSDVRKGEPLKAPIEGIIKSRVLSEKVNGDRAFVKFTGPAGPGTVVFIREQGKWKLDVAATEQEKAASFDGTAE